MGGNAMIPWVLAGKGWFLNNAKWIVLGILAVVALWAGKQVYDAFQEREQLLKEREGTITNLVQDKTILQTERDSAKAAINRLLIDKARLQYILQTTIQTQIEIRDEIRAQKQIFEKHDFDKLAQAKPGLIQTRANRATQERFDELQDAFNR